MGEPRRNTVPDCDRLALALVECVTGSLLHAVANFTNVIVGRVGILEMLRPDDPEVQRAAREIRGQVDGISALGARMREFVVTTDARTSDAEDALRRVLDGVGPAARRRAIRLRTAFESDLPLQLPPFSLYAILHGLLAFAVRAAPPESEVRLEASRDSGHASVVLTLPVCGLLPSTRRELTAPWLTGEVEDRDARLLLAVALGSVIERGGRFETTRDGNEERVIVSLALAQSGAR